MSCPGSTANGCRCWEHDPGLAEYARDPDAYLASLPQPTRLQVVTAGPRDQLPCEGTFTCTCSACTRERGILQNAPRAAIRQPWDVRPSRNRAA